MSRTRSLCAASQYSVDKRREAPFSSNTVFSATKLPLEYRRSIGNTESIIPSETLRKIFGLLSVELHSSADSELFLDSVPFFFSALENSLSWLMAFSKEAPRGRDLGSNGELNGEESVEEDVSLSKVPERLSALSFNALKLP